MSAYKSYQEISKGLKGDDYHTFPLSRTPDRGMWILSVEHFVTRRENNRSWCFSMHPSQIQKKTTPSPIASRVYINQLGREMFFFF